MLDSAPDFQAAYREMSERRRAALDKLVAKIHEVVTLPNSAFELLGLVQSPDVDARQLTVVIKKDPALATRILSQVNSSQFGLSHQVTDLGHAIALLGQKEIRNIALTLTCGPTFGTPHSLGDYSRENLWRHCVLVGFLSEELAIRIKHPQPGVFYTAGLLHDLGWILMDHYMPRSFAQTLELIQSGDNREEAELQAFTFEHTILGAALGERWNLPIEVLCSMLYHHSPRAYSGSHRSIVNAVSIANYFVDHHATSSLGLSTTQFPGDEIFQALGLTGRQTQEILATLPSLIEKSDALCGGAVSAA